jgi:hypothetical protein
MDSFGLLILFFVIASTLQTATGCLSLAACSTPTAKDPKNVNARLAEKLHARAISVFYQHRDTARRQL